MLVLSRSIGQSLAICQATTLTVVRIGANDMDLRVDGARAKRVGDPAPRGMKPGTTFAMQRHEQLQVFVDEDNRAPVRVVLMNISEDRVRIGADAPADMSLSRVD